jgi:uncharacterized protein (TIGR03435 family)
MGLLADQLSTGLWRVVVDKTGLTGEYTFRLEWTPTRNDGPESLGLPPVPQPASSGDSANIGPSIFTAL